MCPSNVVAGVEVDGNAPCDGSVYVVLACTCDCHNSDEVCMPYNTPKHPFHGGVYKHQLMNTFMYYFTRTAKVSEYNFEDSIMNFSNNINNTICIIKRIATTTTTSTTTTT